MRSLSKVGTPIADFYTPADSPFPFAEAVWAGDTVYLSGQIGLGPDGLVEGFEAQVRKMMDNLAATLHSLGLGMDNLVKCTVFMADMAQWQDFNRIYISYFQPGRYPARSALGATGLALGAAVEIDCIALAGRTVRHEQT
jgi:reactive intermediate/imine deaminase